MVQREIYHMLCDLNDVEPSNKKFIGHYDDRELPIKQGQWVTIPKGTKINTVSHGTRVAGKTYRVKVHRVLPGSVSTGRDYRFTNPRVVWPGTGGYWSEADINDIPEAADGPVVAEAISL